MKLHIVPAGTLILLALGASQVYAADQVDFSRHIQPILEATCISCHGPERPRGGLRLDTLEFTLEGGDYFGPALVPGDPEKSPLYTSTVLPEDDLDLMPPVKNGGPLPKTHTDLLRRWIEEGAEWPEGKVLTAVPNIDFVKDIQPILERHCVTCHREDYDKGGLRLDTKAMAFTSGDYGPSIIPFDALNSTTYTTTILPEDHPDLMPPAKSGGPLPQNLTDLLRDWINQGAIWPEDLILTPRKEEQPEEDEFLLSAIFERIADAPLPPSEAGMKPYKQLIPGTNVSYEMVPIPGGRFKMGSPEDEEDRNPAEGPQIKVEIEPFWMGKFEVTWNEFELFMFPTEEIKLRTRIAPEHQEPLADAVSRPTAPYVEMSFGMGKDGFPAISMTQHAASMYCKWLSAKTGHFYRLPTEAEWEYAARAGTTTAYSFGDDPAMLDEYAWYQDNSDWKYQKVGTKKPNPWGLHDMHGNVAEWTLDQYDPDFYRQFVGETVKNPWNRSTSPYPHTVRGGSWDDPPELLRSAARMGSDPSWKAQDPQLPKSIWFHTDAVFVGFRLIRPLAVPSVEEMEEYWHNKVEFD
jgi:formylglycine-generating enzyme required for sulfatase activity/mono/diheme cytochrome c family protein